MLPRDGKNIVSDYEKDPIPILKDVAKKAREAVQPGYTAVPPAPCGTPPEKADISRLPESGALLFGRREELKFLDQAWAERKLNVVVFRASGGIGKSTLVAAGSRSWPRTTTRVPSGYLPGPSSARVPATAKASRVGSRPPISSSARRCISSATRPAGWPLGLGPRREACRSGPRTSARCSCSTAWSRCSPPMRRSSAGRLQIPASRPWSRNWRATTPASASSSTRSPIANLADADLKDRVAHVDLNFVTRWPVEPCCGSGVSKARTTSWSSPSKPSADTPMPCSCLGVTWSSSAVRRSLPAARFPRGQSFRRKCRHPRRVVAAFAGKFGAGSAEVELLRVLGLFDRPAEGNAIAAVRAGPIPGLTEVLPTSTKAAGGAYWIGFARRGWSRRRAATRRMRWTRIRWCGSISGEELRAKHPEAWQAGHARLYEHFKALPEKHQPDTLEEMEPLFQAVFHGCQAGRHENVLLEVYWPRIVRNQEDYLTSKLCAFGTDLAALAGCFDPPWQRPVASIPEAGQAFVLNQVGFCLRALGRLQDAVQPMRVVARWLRQSRALGSRQASPAI